MESRATGCPLLFGSKVGVAHDPGADRMRREIAGEILRFLEGEKYLRERRVARNRKNLGGGRSDEAGREGGDGGRWGLDTVRARLRRAVADGGVIPPYAPRLLRALFLAGAFAAFRIAQRAGPSVRPRRAHAQHQSLGRGGHRFFGRRQPAARAPESPDMVRKKWTVSGLLIFRSRFFGLFSSEGRTKPGHFGGQNISPRSQIPQLFVICRTTSWAKVSPRAPTPDRF